MDDMSVNPTMSYSRAKDDCGRTRARRAFRFASFLACRSSSSCFALASARRCALVSFPCTTLRRQRAGKRSSTGRTGANLWLFGSRVFIIGIRPDVVLGRDVLQELVKGRIVRLQTGLQDVPRAGQ